ncbi:MAG: O-antigen ligase family protein, partial [Microgenomates group bacterium]
PLYPKLPLFDIIPGYIVRVRIEDIVILGVVLFWVTQVFRKKAFWRNSLNPLIGLYLLAGLTSIVSAVFILGTIPLELLHVAKSSLHLLRYLEYFMLFFIFFSSIKKTKDLKIVALVLMLTVCAIALYGIGQKYLYWPVYSTMNREFSKGIRLILTDHARVQSTFGGHYDLAAYLVITLPLLLGLALTNSNSKFRVSLWISFILGIWLLVVSGARMSFASFIVAVTITVALIALKKESWEETFRWGFSRLSIVGFITLFIFVTFGDDMYERFLQTLEGYPELNQTYHKLNEQRKTAVYEYVLVPLGIESLLNQPENSITIDEAEVLVSSDQQPTPIDIDDSNKPSDVYVEVPDIQEIITTSETGEQTITYIARERTYSDNALRHGLSLAIRLDTLWPQAIAGFQKNPLFGSGYATLNKQSPTDFTEADSTDNNFLRTLGETGLFGFITFYGIVIFATSQAFRLTRTHKITSLEFALAAGFFGASIGILLNAFYIDVFAASKVAVAYWSFSGVLMAVATLNSQKNKGAKIQ